MAAFLFRFAPREDKDQYRTGKKSCLIAKWLKCVILYEESSAVFFDGRGESHMEDISKFIPARFVESKNAFIVTNADGEVLWVNPALTILCGYEPSELEGKKPGQILQGPESDPKVIENMRDAIEAGMGCTVELINYHKDGHSYPVYIEITPVEDLAGKVKFFAAIERQFTEMDIREVGRETLQRVLHSILQDFVQELKRKV